MAAAYPHADSLTLAEVLARLDAGDMVSLTVVKYDRQRGTGGGLMEILQCRLAPHAKEDWGPRSGFGESPMPDDVKFGPGVEPEAQDRRYPNHGKHFTRNVVLYSAGVRTSRIVKIHPPLITKCDGHTVL